MRLLRRSAQTGPGLSDLWQPCLPLSRAGTRIAFYETVLSYPRLRQTRIETCMSRLGLASLARTITRRTGGRSQPASGGRREGEAGRRGERTNRGVRFV